MTDFQWGVFQAALDPVTGAEQQGTRPVLVVSNEDFNQVIPNVTVLPLTSARRRMYPAEVLLPARKAGQPFESIIMAHQIRTISKQRLGALVGRLEDAELRERVLQAIREHLDLGE
jgi:mRNA interferase MazF